MVKLTLEGAPLKLELKRRKGDLPPQKIGPPPAMIEIAPGDWDVRILSPVWLVGVNPLKLSVKPGEQRTLQTKEFEGLDWIESDSDKPKRIEITPADTKKTSRILLPPGSQSVPVPHGAKVESSFPDSNE